MRIFWGIADLLLVIGGYTFFSLKILLHKFGFTGGKILEIIFICVNLQNEWKGAFGNAVIMMGSRIKRLKVRYFQNSEKRTQFIILEDR